MSDIFERLNDFNKRYTDAESNKAAVEKSREMLRIGINEENAKLMKLKEADVLNKKAIAVLNKLSEEALNESFAFIEDSLNDVLAKIFVNSPRKIRLVESMRGEKIPELNIELTAANGVKRSLKTDSGHGLRQMVSLLCILCVICISGVRKFVVLDEVFTGLSKESRIAINDILWSFTTIGFQFVIAEHGFIAKGAKVYQLRLDNDVSRIVDEYIEPEGYFLSGIRDIAEG